MPKRKQGPAAEGLDDAASGGLDTAITPAQAPPFPPVNMKLHPGHVKVGEAAWKEQEAAYQAQAHRLAAFILSGGMHPTALARLDAATLGGFNPTLGVFSPSRHGTRIEVGRAKGVHRLGDRTCTLLAFNGFAAPIIERLIAAEEQFHEMPLGSLRQWTVPTMSGHSYTLKSGCMPPGPVHACLTLAVNPQPFPAR